MTVRLVTLIKGQVHNQKVCIDIYDKCVIKVPLKPPDEFSFISFDSISHSYNVDNISCIGVIPSALCLRNIHDHFLVTENLHYHDFD